MDALLPHLPTPLDDVVRFAFATGWRRGEILGLTWAMVFDGEIRLPDSKNGKPRSVPTVAGLAEVIERQRKRRVLTSPFVFHRDGVALNRTVFGKQFRSACVKAGLGQRDAEGVYAGRIFHDLRRSAVRNLIRAGVHRSVAKSISGHETDSVFDRYNITSDEDQKLALEASRL